MNRRIRAQIRVLVFSCLLWTVAVSTIVERCLDGDRASLIFDGAPSPTTPLLLRTLKKLGVTAMFAVDPHKVSVGGSAQIIKNIIEDGHVLGLSLSNNIDLNTMSDEGLRGTLEKASADIVELVNKRPLLVKIPRTTTRERVAFLEGMGYLVILPDLDLGAFRPGQCLQQLVSRLGEQSLWNSPIISVGDTDAGCDAEEVAKMIASVKEHKMTLAKLDVCIGLEKPYKTSQRPDDLTLPDLPEPVARRPAPVVVQESALKNAVPTVAPKYYGVCIIGFLLHWLVN